MTSRTNFYASLLRVIAAIVLAGAGFGCSNIGSRSGEIFLVAASGESQRLGLVEVFAVPPEAAAAETLAALAKQQKLLNAAERQMASAKSAREKFSAEMKIRSDGMHAAVQRATDLVEKSSNLKRMANQASVDVNKLLRLSEAESAAKASRDQALQGLLDLWTVVVASPHAATKSDSIGAFAISCREHDFICAYTTRTFSDLTQHLIWIVGADKMPPSGKVLLSNDNLLALPSE